MDWVIMAKKHVVITPSGTNDRFQLSETFNTFFNNKKWRRRQDTASNISFRNVFGLFFDGNIHSSQPTQAYLVHTYLLCTYV